jgi:hypothetical protein
MQTLRGHVPPAVERLQPLTQLANTNRLRLALGLPLRDRPALTNFLQQLYAPASPQYRQYLNPAQFAQKFGPTEQDYAALIGFARANGFNIVATHPNRLVLDVEGGVGDVERTLRVKLLVYPHPTEARTFYAPNAEPTVDSKVPLLHIAGLNNCTTPQPRDLHEISADRLPNAAPRFGSGPNGEYTGNDFRTVYVPATSLTGAGQTVGLFELNGYYPNDITSYENQWGLPHVPLQNVLIDGFSGSPGGRRPGSLNEEVALDIEMSISMAPGLSKVLVYEGAPNGNTATIDDILNRMATDNLAQQLSCSWGFDIDETSQQIFLQFAAQGQSFFLASGDSGAFSGPVLQPSDNPNITVVGGTTLTTDNSQVWTSETTWSGSSGGISTLYPIPDWQMGIDMSANQGSTTMRNTPDIAMVADNVLAVADQGRSIPLSGTSIAAPLWAGFTALINERAAAQGKPPIGFINPVLYKVGKSPSYTTTFHDITSGSNANSSSPSLFPAVTGYDLCTGWGTPNGTNLIEALLAGTVGGLVITPPLGFIGTGPVGGPFQGISASYTLTNAGTASLNWSAGTTGDWLSVSPPSGSLAPGGSSSVVKVSLSSSASKSLIASYSAVLSFTNLTSGNVQTRSVSLDVGNGGFETGDFTDWTFAAQTDNSFADSVDSTQLYGTSSLPGVDDSNFVHSGIYGAFLGQTNSLGYISQTLPTVAGQGYVISFWLANPAVGTPNEFLASWDGNPLVDLVNADQFAWTNFQYVVTASAATAVLQFGFQNDLNAFALDDITVQPVAPPAAPKLVAAPRITEGAITLTWTVVSQANYQVQYATDLSSGNWTNLGNPVTTTNSTVSVSDTIGAPRRFYRLVAQ